MRQKYEKWSSFWVNSRSIKVDKFDLYHAIITRQFFLFFFCFFYFFVIETSEQHTAIDLVNFVYYPTGFV